ncbi:MAG: glycosyltransferase family 2 protein [Armatimonadetes bacterium]|nr:glycosyltransferase family 2 protein [Armatimonadota bacterium]
MDATPPPKLSIVAPVYNEEESVGLLYRKLVEALDPLPNDYEIILVNDGSRDGTAAVLDALASADEHVVVGHLRRNFGQSAAMQAGFDLATGDVVIAMDADLQNDPADIPLLLAKLDEGFDVVSGWRKDRKDKWLTRVLPSNVANWLISTMTGVRLHDYGCSLKAYRREVLADVTLYGELHRFIPALAYWAGGTVAEVPVTHHSRQFGQSKYGLSRIFRVVLDLIAVKFLLSYSTKPIRIFGQWGCLAGALGSAVLAYLAYVKLILGADIGHRPLLLLGILLVFMAGQFITLGLVAELQARIYYEARGRPVYALRRVVGRGADGP